MQAIEVGSPDFWAFVGKLNPLEVIRQWVQDAHERRKDREYKEPAEARKLELDNEMKRVEIEDRELANELKKIEIFDRKIGIAKQLGATDEDLAPMVRNLFYKPLKRLERFNDSTTLSKVWKSELRTQMRPKVRPQTTQEPRTEKCGTSRITPIRSRRPLPTLTHADHKQQRKST